MLAPQLQLTMQLLPLNCADLYAYLQQQLQHNPILNWRTNSNSSQSAFDVALATQHKQSQLTDHLLLQLGLEYVTDEQHQCAEIIIDALDHDGYLRISINELKQQNLSLAAAHNDWQQALQLVHSFEPTGVGARNLIECLSLQLEQNFAGDAHQKLALQLVEQHLQSLAKPDIPALAEALASHTANIDQAIQLIHGLNPRPGSLFEHAPIDYIRPDLRFTRTLKSHHEPVFIAELSHAFSGQIEIQDSGTSSQLRQAKALLSALSMREQSLLRVGEFLASHQSAFLEHGVSAIRPLTRLQLAEHVNLHPSTVTRALQGKYAETSRGIISLKQFFSVALTGKSTRHTSLDQTKHLPAAAAALAQLEQLIKDEDRKKPLSDNELCQQLQQAGFPVARRTVVKYRQLLGIENSRKRRNS